MRNVEVCLTPELLPLYQVSDKAVVIVDILRATSCMVAGLASGVRSIVPVAKLDEALALRKEGYICAGERDGKQVEGFDIGNSPFSFMREAFKGRSIAMTTTNGTQAIARSRHARQVLIGAFLNLSALADFLINQDDDVLIVCAGWKGKFNLEDTLFAGALARKLEGHFQTDDDATIAARELYANMQADMHAHIKHSSHYKRLAALGIKEDIQFCLQADRLPVVPLLRDKEIVLP